MNVLRNSTDLLQEVTQIRTKIKVPVLPNMVWHQYNYRIRSNIFRLKTLSDQNATVTDQYQKWSQMSHA